MKVTDVRLRRLQPNGKMRGYASVTLDDEFVVHEMRIIDGPKGLFVAMPSRRSADGEFRDIAHPITPEARQYIQAAVLEAFQHAAAQQAAEDAQPAAQP
jgi:stage V sporulation protein G